MAHRLSITTLPTAANGHMFAGKVERLDDPDLHHSLPLGVIPYLWMLHGRPRGWHPATSGPIVVQPHGRWSIRIPTAQQYAVLLVRSRFELPPSVDGTLPNGAIDGLFASPLKVTILSAPERPLNGFVNALSPPEYRPGPVGSEPRHRWEDLRVMAWARKDAQPETDDADGNDAAIGGAEIKADGYWEFDEIHGVFREARSYCVALITNEFQPNGVPDTRTPGVRAVACHDHMTLPKARGAGRRGP